jgi:hypothetical protein
MTSAARITRAPSYMALGVGAAGRGSGGADGGAACPSESYEG